MCAAIEQNLSVRSIRSPLGVPKEGSECETLFQWAHYRTFRGVRLSQLLVMIPNGQWLGGDTKQRARIMNKLKLRGFRSGASDYFLAIPASNFSGMWLEMKRTKRSATSQEQEDFGMLMMERGYQFKICKGALEAITEIEVYLKFQAGETTAPIGNNTTKGISNA